MGGVGRGWQGVSLAGRRCCQSHGLTVGVCHTCAKAVEFNLSCLDTHPIGHGCSVFRKQVGEGGGAHSQNERSNNTGSAGDDSICTVCVCVCVVKWNKFSTPQRYVKRKDRVGEVGERNVGITATSSTVTGYT